MNELFQRSPFGQISGCHSRDESSFELMKLLIYTVLSHGEELSVMTSLAFQASTGAVIRSEEEFIRFEPLTRRTTDVGSKLLFFLKLHGSKHFSSSLCFDLRVTGWVGSIQSAILIRGAYYASPKSFHSTDPLLLLLTPPLSFSI